MLDIKSHYRAEMIWHSGRTLTSMQEALGSIPSTPKNKAKKHRDKKVSKQTNATTTTKLLYFQYLASWDLVHREMNGTK